MQSPPRPSAIQSLSQASPARPSVIQNPFPRPPNVIEVPKALQSPNRPTAGIKGKFYILRVLDYFSQFSLRTSPTYNRLYILAFTDSFLHLEPKSGILNKKQGGISNKEFNRLVDKLPLDKNAAAEEEKKAVSYTHLTLPTILRV